MNRTKSAFPAKVLIIITLCLLSGCDNDAPSFSVALSRNRNPYAAGKQAAKKAIEGLGKNRPKALIFTVYCPSKQLDLTDPAAYLPDVKSEQDAVRGISEIAGPVQNVGIRTRPMAVVAEASENCVAVLAMGGKKISCRSVAVPITKNRKKTGAMIGGMLSKVDDLRMALVLSEMSLNFDPLISENPENFVAGLRRPIPDDTVIFGGNGMNDPAVPKSEGLKGAQFFNGKTLEGYVVAVGIGGDFNVVAGRAIEFTTADIVEATKTVGNWIIELDNCPAADVYRKILQMGKDRELTSDWQHAVGIESAGGDVVVRMILDWIDPKGLDRTGNHSKLPAGSLMFRRTVKPGRKIHILKGGDSYGSITSSARRCADNLVKVAEKEGKPLCMLVSDCWMRRTRLNCLNGNEAGMINGITGTARGGKFPVFGFYSFGGLGAVEGKNEEPVYTFQQNTFLGAVIVED